MNRDAAQAAAAWWAEQILSTTPETDGLHSGQTLREGFVAVASIGLRALELNSAAPVTDEVVWAFAADLADRITASGQERMRLFVDYAPDRTLGDAADAARLDTAHFPRKTAMTVWPDHIVAKAGYGAPWLLVWSAPGWEHPPCGVQDWPENSDDPVGPECALPKWHEGGHGWA